MKGKLPLMFLGILISALTIYFLGDLPDLEYERAEDFANVYDLETIHKTTPKAAFDGKSNQYEFGRYRSPIKFLNMHTLTPLQKLVQLKEFVYTAISDDEWFVGSALLQFNYNAAAIVYAYHLKTNQSYIAQLELPIASFLGTSFDVNSSAINQCVRWKKGMLGLTALKCYNRISNSYDVQLSGHFHRVENNPRLKHTVPFQIEYSISLQGQAMSMIFPLGPNRPSMVTKYAGAVSSGRMVLNNQEYQFSEPLGMMDWTRGLLRRLTYWHWLCASWTDQTTDTLYGLQLSEGTYDNPQNVSLESTLWKNGKAHHINSRIIFTPLNPQAKAFETDWKVHSEDETIQLTFRFGQVIKGSFHYGLIDGDLFHMWGGYSGTIRLLETGEVIQLSNVPGTLEDHYALW